MNAIVAETPKASPETKKKSNRWDIALEITGLDKLFVNFKKAWNRVVAGSKAESDRLKSEVVKKTTEKTSGKESYNPHGRSITREDAIAKYGKTPAVRNFNPGNIEDTKYGGQKVTGERFTRFATPKEGFEALVAKIKNIQAGNSKVYDQNSTLEQYLHIYAPSHENNTSGYVQKVAADTNAHPHTPIKEIDPVQLALSHVRKEDGQMYKMMKDLELIV